MAVRIPLKSKATKLPNKVMVKSNTIQIKGIDLNEKDSENSALEPIREHSCDDSTPKSDRSKNDEYGMNFESTIQRRKRSATFKEKRAHTGDISGSMQSIHSEKSSSGDYKRVIPEPTKHPQEKEELNASSEQLDNSDSALLANHLTLLQEQQVK